jgi:phage anti-repressor protein
MLKFNDSTLKRIEDLFKILEYKIRFEKGQFQSGYCLVKSQKMIVVNKFFTTEARINCLVEILTDIEIDKEILAKMDESALKLLAEIKHPSINSGKQSELFEN